MLPIFSKEQYATSLEWVKDYVNVPLDNMTGYTDVMFTQPVIPEVSACHAGHLRRCSSRSCRRS